MGLILQLNQIKNFKGRVWKKMKNLKTEIQNYLKHLEEVPGWMGVGAANLMLAIDEYQTNIQTNKDYFEIGVHHGRSAILFGLLAKHKNLSLSV